MSQFLIRFNTSNAAFTPDEEPDRPRELTTERRHAIAQILKELADVVDYDSRTEGPVLDINGNIIGRWEWATDHRRRAPR